MIDPMAPSDPATRAVPPSSAPRNWSDLLPRVLSALVMGAAALGTAATGGPLFVLFWLLAAGAVFWEWQHLIGPERFFLRFGVGAAALAVGIALVGAGHPAFGTLVLLAGVGAVAVVAPPSLRAVAPAGLVYAAVLALAVTLLRRGEPDGMRAILWLFAVVWGTDVMAYFGGRLVGGPKLWPRLSPKKTWSGFLIGIGAGACLGLLAAPAGSNRAVLLLVGLLAGVLAQGGDLFESSLKRRYGAKDSGRLIPGHGGVMDRLDGFIAAAAFAALLGVLRAGLDGTSAGLLNW